MQVKFWGVRGSIPSSGAISDVKWKLRAFIDIARKYPDTLTDPEEFIKNLPRHLIYPVGGNTSCLEVKHGQTRIILDMGSGLRALGAELSHKAPPEETDFYLAAEAGRPLSEGLEDRPLNLNILLSHTHWDHIQGFPFFTPAYSPGNRLTIYGRNGEQIRQALALQQTAPSLFPIPLEGLKAEIKCLDFPSQGLQLDGIEISSLPLPHPGGSQAYRLKAGGRTVVYATDYEYPNPNSEEAAKFIEFIDRADVLISDTQYTYLEGMAKEGWGHSTSFGALDLAMRAGVGNFFLFHHDPEHSDAKLYDSLDKTTAYYKMMSGNGRMNIGLAAEGLVI